MSNYVLSPQAVRKLKTALQGKRGTGGAHMNGPANVYESEYPAPFAVQWAQSVGDSGSWIIWLPGASLVMLGGTPLDVREDLDAAGSGYPSGWYTLEDILPATGGTLYLLITIPQEEEEESGSSSSSSSSSASASETEEPTAELSARAGTAPTITIPVCVAATEAVTGRKSVKQFITSTVFISGSVGETALGAFAFSGGKIHPGAVVIGRQAYKVNEDGFDIEEDGEGDGDYRVRVELDPYGGDPTIEVQYGDGFAAPPSELVSYFPLYTIEGGRVTADFRGTFVLPVLESAQEASE